MEAVYLKLKLEISLLAIMKEKSRYGLSFGLSHVRLEKCMAGYFFGI